MIPGLPALHPGYDAEDFKLGAVLQPAKPELSVAFTKARPQTKKDQLSLAQYRD
jgi:hypothetical protein